MPDTTGVTSDAATWKLIHGERQALADDPRWPGQRAVDRAIAVRLVRTACRRPPAMCSMAGA